MKLNTQLLFGLAFTIGIMSCGSDEEPFVSIDTYSISGNIKGSLIDYSNVTLSIGAGEIKANADGSFKFTELSGGQKYNIVPSLNGHHFAPDFIEVTISNQDVDSGVDFKIASDSELFYKDEVWTKFNMTTYDVEMPSESNLILTLVENALWYQNNLGGLVYQEVTGNFIITTTALARKSSNPTETVTSPISLGGLMVRNPNGVDMDANENSLHIVTGNTPDGVGVETKNTTEGQSPFTPVPTGKGDNELRICRNGNSFKLFYKEVGAADWILADEYLRSDLPNTVQVGMNIYTTLDNNSRDLQVTFENTIIELFDNDPDCN